MIIAILVKIKTPGDLMCQGIKMIACTVIGKKMEYAGEVI